MDIRADDKKYIANTYNRFDVVISGGHGAEIIDNDGKKYIDMGSGIAVNIFGIGDENWTDAVKGQLDKFAHTSNLYYSAPPVALAKMLCEKTGMKKVFFANSGAEVNECAIKLARRHGEKNLDGAFKIICLKQSFHGRTLATLSATGQDVFHQSFLPLVDGFLFCEPNNITEFKSLVGNNKCCAVLFEMIQGEGGINVLDTDFVKECFAICKEKNLLFMADEVQTGNGRTGELYAFMNFGILPDVFTTAKGLGGGLPIGACVMGKKAENLFLPGDNGSTFGANPAICAGACSVL